MVRIGLYSEDRKLLAVLSSALGREFQVWMEPSEAEVTRNLDERKWDAVILDLDSTDPELDSRVDACKRIVAAPVSAVVLTDDSLRGTADELIRLGAYSHCRKPPSVRELRAVMRRAHERSQLSRERSEAAVPSAPEEPASCDQMIGSSPQMRRIYDLVRRVARVNASVLVTGESGTGKELIARAIHALGTNALRPFVAVSCGAIPETLIEAELFGHEKGAFTGTVGAREGYLEQAGEGTLFLDEIGELSPAVQVKLLRVLQQREFNRLGSTRLIPLRARLIFATHADLGELVAQGRFRLDLYYRINVMKITAPPLQERVEDIPLIATHFLRHYSQIYQKPMDGIRSEAMALLQGYAWPGNVRELENVIQRAIILSSGTYVEEEDLPPNIHDETVVPFEDYQPASSFERQLRDYKVKLAEAAVRENHGNKTMAARSLNISRAYLHRLLRLSDQDLPPERDGGRVSRLDTETA